MSEGPAVLSGVSMKTVDKGTSRASVLRQADADLGKVVENRLLTSPNAPAKRHIGECTEALIVLYVRSVVVLLQSLSCRST